MAVQAEERHLLGCAPNGTFPSSRPSGCENICVAAEVSWPTVTLSAGISVGASALVTLGLDYFARPGLEARKERLLDRYRIRRIYADRFLSMQINAGMLTSMKPPAGLTDTEKERFQAEIDRVRQTIVDTTEELMAASGAMLFSGPKALRDSLAGTVGRNSRDRHVESNERGGR